MDDPSNKRRWPSVLGAGSQATLLSGSVGLPCQSLVGAALPKTPYLDWKRGIDLFRSPNRRRMTRICTKGTSGVDVKGSFRIAAERPHGMLQHGCLARVPVHTVYRCAIGKLLGVDRL